MRRRAIPKGPARAAVTWDAARAGYEPDWPLHKEDRLLFMVIEDFGRDPKAVYRRLRDKGRGFPDGLSFVGSWVTADMRRCFQLMECDDVTLLQRWVADRCDLIEFNIVPVVAGKDTAAALAPHL